jgi:hypothetical protein
VDLTQRPLEEVDSAPPIEAAGVLASVDVDDADDFADGDEDEE